MQVNPYLFYDGNCKAALTFYAKALGAKIDGMMSYGDAPPTMPMPPETRDFIMHARLTIDGEVIMAADAFPGHFKPAQGFAVSLLVPSPADAEARFKALSEGGTVTMPFAPTFFAKGFGTCTDQFGVPWMIYCPIED